MNIVELKRLIHSTLSLEITNDYILLDLPYYTNIGDTLIWEGTKEFLSTIPYRCLYATDMNFFIERKLSTETIILLLGGGNFGDKYREHTAFRKRIIKLYPRNKIIILPQSVYYKDEYNLKNDVEFYSQYHNVTICTRERFSYEFIKRNFVYNRTILVPDLAFYINIDKYNISSSFGKTLFVRRLDSELLSESDYSKVPKDADVYDWPTYYSEGLYLKTIYYIFRCLKFLSSICGRRLKNKLEDIKRNVFYRKKYVQMGVDFLSQYDTIYSTRLHVMILAVLLGKRIYIYNNETGKLANFYNTWLLDYSNINLLTD